VLPVLSRVTVGSGQKDGQKRDAKYWTYSNPNTKMICTAELFSKVFLMKSIFGLKFSVRPDRTSSLVKKMDDQVPT
jgi:hypothetical protein